MFIELENTIEGLVHISNLTDDYYNFDERSMSMIGERTARVFRLGDKVTIKVHAVNLEESAVDFIIVGMPAPRAKSTRPTRVINAGGKKGSGSSSRKKKDDSKPKSKRTPSGAKVSGKTRKQERKRSTEGEPKKEHKGKKFYEGIAKQQKKKGRKKKN